MQLSALCVHVIQCTATQQLEINILWYRSSHILFPAKVIEKAQHMARMWSFFDVAPDNYILWRANRGVLVFLFQENPSAKSARICICVYCIYAFLLTVSSDHCTRCPSVLPHVHYGSCVFLTDTADAGVRLKIKLHQRFMISTLWRFAIAAL